jgi:hypothetical protein
LIGAEHSAFSGVSISPRQSRPIFRFRKPAPFLSHFWNRMRSGVSVFREAPNQGRWTDADESDTKA